MERKIQESKFLLSMQSIVDEFDEDFLHIQFYKGNDEARLKGVRLYYGQEYLNYEYVYLVKDKDLPNTMETSERGSLIVLGQTPPYYIQNGFTVIELEEKENLLRVTDICQEIFELNERWSDKLRDILIHDGSVDDLCKASYEYFKNPLFVHDAQLYVVSCPVWREGMVNWLKDEKTGLVITPMDTINEFKTDKEYLRTLNTKGAKIFSASLRGYRDIYVNIWDDYGKYIARLGICELETPLKPGQMLAAEYLSKMIKIALEQRNRLDSTYNRALELLLDGMVRGEKYPDEEISNRINQYGWKLHDEYVCIRMDIEERDRHVISVVSLCNDIEARVAGSKAFCDEIRICIVINLTVNGHHTSDVAYILREGLFKAGVSNHFRDFTKLGIYYQQASIALKYCRKKNDTKWSASFHEAALDYLIDSSCPDMDISYICSEYLMKLKRYDENNEAELYDTLKAYLEHNGNTVKTAKELYIGRSTLFYRMRKIKELVGLDSNQLENAKTNLYLRLSFYILDREF